MATKHEGTCPRCGGEIDPNATGDEGALSRVDNRTMVCSKCGREESEIAPRGSALHSKAGWVHPDASATAKGRP